MDYNKFLAGRANWIKGSALAEVMKKAAELQSKGKNLISLAAGDPDPNLIPREVLGELAKEVLANIPSSVMYTPANGIPELREEVAKFLRKYEHIEVSSEEIIITVGGTGALDLLGRVLIDPGDVVITENPSYINTILAFEQLGAKVEGVPVDSEGMEIDALQEKIRELKSKGQKIKFIYTIPTGQNPMGITMSEERRKALLEIASEYDLLIVEDTAYNFMKYEEREIRPLKALDKEGRVIVAGTLSKVLGTGFRIGWIIAKGEIRDKVLMEKSPIDFCAPTISQYIALEYLKRGYFEEYHLKRALQGYKEKRDAMINALQEYLPNAEFTKPIAGMFVMLFLPENADGMAFASELMERKGVVVVPGKPFYTDESGRNTIRLNFSRPSKEDIDEGIKRLAELYNEKF
ncbi:PLP-dependent aminotransferase family protein [Thermococcus sp. M39]|uniref:aminotransferase-like domain-containing protein n=1 Tax=unclassified Thermococcus TaxID=2627626 RepID=UPI00143B9C9F|nr:MULTISPECIES: PLP-dependent aminotransferase family protein [unclassified Thermococcus]NJE08004.1 PLP-dependent aminotransferase family protein [Thermococcus sp. M39]NJE13800.1 PLP-dependent aminotransferase family protein [Thermococcus sp. LS2]